MSILKNSLAVLFYLLLVDGIWLKFIAGGFFSKHARGFMREDGIVLWAALIVYIVMAVSLVYFVGPQLHSSDRFWIVFLKGAALGFALYAVFDFTNYAVFTFWPLSAIALDLLWGSFLMGSAALFLRWVR